ncbi:MAG: hypothetical protein WCO84_05800 [bacterium]
MSNGFMKKSFTSLFLFCLVALPFVSNAYLIEKIGTDGIAKDIVVGPGKQEFYVEPGETVRTELMVSNRMGEDRIFNIAVEDMMGTRDLSKSVELLGDKTGPYTLKNYIKFESPKFTLQNGTRARVPVTITIPKNAEPGGMYGSVLFSTVKAPDKEPITVKNDTKGAIPIEIRSGVLFFVRIAGAVKEDGKMKEFKIMNDESTFWGDKDITFSTVYENNGSVHLNPSGTISVTNMFGEEVRSLEMDPWFSLPDSLRSREMSIGSDNMMGWYTAKVKLYKGYGDDTDPKSYDEASVSFVVIPLMKLLYLFLFLLVAVVLLRWFKTNFQFERKRK